MKQSWFLSGLLPGFALALSGCEVIGDIFEAGVWVGVILVLGVVGVIIWIVSKMRG